MAGFKVTAPLVQAKKQDGTFVHVYEGGFLPEDVDEDQLAQLVDSEMVEEADAPSEDPSEESDSGSRRRKKG